MKTKKPITRDELLKHTPDEGERAFWTRLWDTRSVGDYPCQRCTGVGVYSYGSAATWSRGIGGQTMTSGTCDECWGSGDAMRPGVNLRERAQ